MKSFLIQKLNVANSKNDDVKFECRFVAHDGGCEGRNGEVVRREVWFQ